MFRSSAIKKISRKEGFTILEVMVGLVIFSLGLLLLMSMMVVSIKGNTWAEFTTQSTQLIREKIEQIKHDPVTYLNSGSDVVGDYTVSWDVTSATADLAEVEVRVDWTDADSTSYTWSTTTYVQL
jgi:prepilin-type N-terminal cleavage/methylation domain-containing protein